MSSARTTSAASGSVSLPCCTVGGRRGRLGCPNLMVQLNRGNLLWLLLPVVSSNRTSAPFSVPLLNTDQAAKRHTFIITQSVTGSQFDSLPAVKTRHQIWPHLPPPPPPLPFIGSIQPQRHTSFPFLASTQTRFSRSPSSRPACLYFAQLNLHCTIQPT